MKKEMHVCEFVEELLRRMDESKDVNCCEAEIRTLCNLVVAKMGDEKITVETKDA